MKAVIVPHSLNGTVTAPPSKSAGHRSLICAALSDKPVTVFNCGESDDMTATINTLRALGADITRKGLDVYVNPCRKNNRNVELDCNESGSTARFMIPVACALGAENITVTGHGRLPERPFDTIVDVLRQNGITCSDTKLPMTVSGQLKSGNFSLPGNISSQYISGLLLALSIIEGDSRINLTSELQSRDYVMMTINELRCFGAEITVGDSFFEIKGKEALTACDRTVEGDWSQAAFHLSAGAVGGDITVNGLDQNTLQGDSAIVDLLRQFGAEIHIENNSVRVKKAPLHGITVDASQIPDLVPILAVTAAFADGTTAITNAERLRIKESDRLLETAVRLRAFGIDVTETDDGLIIKGGQPQGADVTSANDHRIVMAFSVMAAYSDGTSSIDGCQAINKSYPLFFNDFSSLGGECNVIGNRN
ncbi:MAG: 3-phosphoshikimate 1-carboxyvinyltransferase [Clostridia bacterium]|nr:3-phosphoshikimate 1-carboxyvinyltransferase [Clostridia bacterium]